MCVACRELERQAEMDDSFTLTLADFSYFDENNISKMISEYMLETRFTGVSVSTVQYLQ